MKTTNKKYYLNVNALDLSTSKSGVVMNDFGIRAGDLIHFETLILANMIAPGDNNPPIAWSSVDFFDVEYLDDFKTLIPYDENDINTYVINNPVGGDCVENASPKVMALSSMCFFVSYLLEQRINSASSCNKLHDLFQSIRGLAYSTEFLSEAEQSQYFKLTN